MTRRPAFLLIGALLLTGCSTGEMAASPDTASTADGVSVGTGLLSFDPEEATVKAGQTVTWVAGDGIRHVLVQGSYELGDDGLRTTQTDDKAFNLTLTKKGQKVSHTYSKPGTFTYYCTVHFGMNGAVRVT